MFRNSLPGSSSVSLDLLFESVDAVVDPRAERPDLIDFSRLEQSELHDHIDRLPEREGVILRMRYGLAPHETPLTLREIGRRLELSRERVRQLEHGAVARLRTAMSAGHATV